MKRLLITLFLILTLIVTPTAAFADSAVSDSELTIPILLYHAIEDSFPPDISNLAITSAGFEEHMRAVMAAGYTPISFAEYYDCINGYSSFPEKPVIITFDDGYLTNYTKAFPILKKYGIKATIFVVAETVGATKGVYYPHFNWWQAMAMEESGLVEIGSHTLSHHDLRSFTPNQLELELRLSKYLIDTNLNKDCTLLAYPFGYHNDAVESAALRAGYKIVCLVEDRGVNTPDTPVTRLKRITVNGYSTGNDLLQIIQTNTEIELKDLHIHQEQTSTASQEEIILQYDNSNKSNIEYDMDAESPVQ